MRTRILAPLAVLALMAAAAHAQGWPAKPVKIVSKLIRDANVKAQ